MEIGTIENSYVSKFQAFHKRDHMFILHFRTLWTILLDAFIDALNLNFNSLEEKMVVNVKLMKHTCVGIAYRISSHVAKNLENVGIFELSHDGCLL